MPIGRDGSMRASTTLASVTVGCVPPRPQHTGPGLAPALSGPTCRMPARSICAMRAAARADRVHVDHRQAQRNAEIQQRVLGDRRLALDHHRDVEAGAAHVAGDDAVVAGLRRQLRRRHHAGRGAGAHDEGGAIGELAHRHHAAVRLHDQRLLVEAPFAELLRASSWRSARPAAGDSPAPRRCWCARTRNIRG